LLRLELSLTWDQLIAHMNAGMVGVINVDYVGRHGIDNLAEDTVTAQVVRHHLTPLFVRDFFGLNLKTKKNRKERKCLTPSSTPFFECFFMFSTSRPSFLCRHFHRICDTLKLSLRDWMEKVNIF
jgi:hypothetical protein